MKLRNRKRRLYEFLLATAHLRRQRFQYRLADLTTGGERIELTDEDREWMNMPPVGHEFGSPDFID